jgi:serine/threonine protein kinase
MARPSDESETAPTARYKDSSIDDDDLGGVEAGAYGSSGDVSADYGASDLDAAFDPDGATLAQSVTSAGAPTTMSGAGSSEETVFVENQTMAEIHAQPVSRRLGNDFELQRQVGQGGMGEVWLARQLSLDRAVAVKVLPRALATQPNFIERFQREARAAARLVHPNVLQIYAYGIDEGTPFFAMEYVKGLDLQQKMKRARGPLEIHEVVGIMLGVAAALQAAHDMGLIHRDIKPSNIMIDDKTGLVKVMDFGLAKATSGGDASKSLTHVGLIMGTPNYLSPEQGRGDKLDGRSDLYSAGIVLYELLTGQLPFRADTPAGLIFKHVYEPPPPPGELRPGLPPFLVEITLRLLAKDPDDRYASGQELLADLTEFIDNMEHYAGGGARIPGRGYQDAQRVANSGSVAVTDAAKRRLSAISSGKLRKLELSPPDDVGRVDEGRVPTTDVLAPPPLEALDAFETKPTEALPKPDLGSKRPPARRKRSEMETVDYSGKKARKRSAPPEPKQRPRRRGRKLIALLALVCGAAVVVYVQRPRWVPPQVYERVDPWVARGLAAYDQAAVQHAWLPPRGAAPPTPAPPPVQSPTPEPTPQPTASPRPTASAAPSPSGVAASPSPRLSPAASVDAPGAVVVGLPSLPEGTRVRLAGAGLDRTWSAGQAPAVPAGPYELSVMRPGYEVVSIDVAVAEVEGAGQLCDSAGDPLALAPEWVPSDELTGAYERAQAALERRDLAAAGIALDQAQRLDPAYAPTGLPTVAELRGRFDELQRTIERTQGQLDELLAQVEAQIEAKEWRAAQRTLEVLQVDRPDDARRLALLSQQGIERGEEALRRAEDELAEGQLQGAQTGLARLAELDPQHPQRGELAARLERAGVQRAEALDEEDLERAAELLEDYAQAYGGRDREVGQRLASVRASLERQARLRHEVEALRDLERAGRWVEAKAAAEAILASAPKHPVASQVLSRAQEELHRGAIVAACAELDRALESGKLEDLLRLLDRGSPAYRVEAGVWGDFQGDAVRGRFLRSAHTLRADAITFSRQPGSPALEAVVRARWTFEIALLREQPHRLELVHRLSLRHVNGHWRFARFALEQE